MRLKQNRLMTIHHRRAATTRDSEGVADVSYEPAETIKAEMWPAGGKLQTEMYGTRLPNIRNLRIEGKYSEIDDEGILRYQMENGPDITVKDGICLYASKDEEPDYEVIAIRPYRFLTLEVERRVGVRKSG